MAAAVSDRSVLHRDDLSLVLLLSLGLFIPTSLHGEYSLALLAIALLILLTLLLSLFWQHGYRANMLATVSLPIMIILTACTLFASSFRFGWGIFAQFGILAIVFALDLRDLQPGRLVIRTFSVVNVLLIAWGVAIVLGIESVSQLTQSWYAQFYPELVPAMLGLHKPVLSFGAHSLAGFFIYLLFWFNWEEYKTKRSSLALTFALCEVALLLALTSFTSLALALLALSQLGCWLSKRSRRAFALSIAAMCVTVLLAGRVLADQLDQFRENAPQIMGALLNSDVSGPLARYGEQGDLRESVAYLREHPFSPVGSTTAPFLFLADSGPVEYLLRGSVPLLLLIYAGLYAFLRHNTPSRRYALTLFLVFLAFELGFEALTYFRTLFLLPFFAAYLKHCVGANSSPLCQPRSISLL